MKYNTIPSHDDIFSMLRQFVDKAMPPDSSIKEMVNWQLRSGGKMLRAKIPYIVAAAHKEDPHIVSPWAAACEVLHNASLIYDDIQDSDHYRRGRPSAWKFYGVESAINLGSTLMFFSALLLEHLIITDKLYRDLISLLMNSTITMINGQEQDIKTCNYDSLTLDRYYDCAKNKTSTLLSLSLCGAAKIYNFPNSKVLCLEKAAQYIGIAFQIKDDLFDIEDNEQQEKSGRDIAEGKKNITVVCCWEMSSDKEKKWLLKILNKPARLTNKEDIEHVIQLVHSTKAIDRAKELMDRYLNKSLSIVSGDPILGRIVSDIYTLAFDRNSKINKSETS